MSSEPSSPSPVHSQRTTAELLELLELLPHATLLIDQDGLILGLNRAVEGIFGYERGELVGQSFQLLVPMSHRATHVAHARHFHETPRARDLGHSRDLIGARRDGTTLVVQVGLSPIETVEGRVVMTSVLDVSARRLAEDGLRASEARFTRLIEALPHMIWTATEDGRPTNTSRRLVEYTGRPPTTEPGLSHLLDVAHPDDRAALSLAWSEARRTHRELRLEHRLRRVDGAYRWFETRAVRTSDGDVVAWVGSCTDVHENHTLRTSLREEETKLRRIAAMTPMVLYSFQMRPDGTNRFPYLSPAVHELTGLGPDDLAGDGSRLFGLVDRRDIDRVIASIAASAHGMTPWKQEFRFATPRGERWADCTAMPVREPDGSTHWFGVMADVTARKKMEKALIESQRRFQLAFETSPIGMVLIRDADLVVVAVNRAYERIAKRAREEVLGQPYVQQQFHPIEVPREELRRRFQVDGTFGGGQPYRFVRGDGVEGYALVWAERIELAGEALGLILIEDVTERRITDERFRQLAETIHEVFWLASADGLRFEYVSPAFESIWGVPREPLFEARARWFDLVHPDDARWLEQLTETQWRVGYDVEYRIIRPDQTVRWVREQAFPVRDERGQVLRVAGIAEDVTERRKLEEQLRQTQKLESIGLLAGGVAHDFNNWLTVVAGCSELLLADLPPGPSETRELLEEIHAAGEGASALTRQLLAFSRKQVHEPQPMELREAVVETEKMLGRLLGEDVVLVTELEDTALVEADPGHIIQVLLNLAVNAREAMPQGGTLTIATADVEVAPGEERGSIGSGRWVRLSMSDTGLGMAPEVCARIFEPFFTTKTVGRGTGLGLSVVHGIIDQSGGHIDVESAVGSGTTFTIHLPAIDEDRRRLPVSQAIVPGGHETILLVEDEALVRRVAERELRRAGFEVLAARGGEEALRIVREHSEVALLVTDVVMPGLDGRELAEAIRGVRPALPVLYTSGYTDDAVLRRGVQASEVAFLGKPYTAAALIAKVRAVIDAARA